MKLLNLFFTGKNISDYLPEIFADQSINPIPGEESTDKMSEENDSKNEWHQEYFIIYNSYKLE